VRDLMESRETEEGRIRSAPSVPVLTDGDGTLVELADWWIDWMRVSGTTLTDHRLPGRFE
jgi:hypothetical protein